MLLWLQHHCFILLFSCRKNVLILYVLVSSPGHFEGVFKLSLLSGNRAKPRERPQKVWNLKLPLTAHHLRLYACLFGYSVIAVKLREKCVDCAIWVLYWTTSKHLPAHHLRLHILFLPTWFQVNFFNACIFVKLCSLKKLSKTLKVTETQAAQERARERRKNS